MIGRIAATSAVIVPVAAAAAARLDHRGAFVQQPVVWFFLGYPFEAAGMIAALFGCVAARFWIGAGQQLRKEHRWLLDFPVSAMTLAVSAGLVIALRPSPFGGLLYGAGAGVLGEGIFKIAEKYLVNFLTAFGADPVPLPEGAADRAGDNLRASFPAPVGKSPALDVHLTALDAVPPPPSGSA